uniref:GAF domain-containing sensor histidine kinase n=1 Tax=Microbacterium sp. TaxID=51671 RepID=UPI002811A022
ARGLGAEPFEGRRYPREDSLVGRALETRSVVVADHSNAEVSTEADMGPSVVLPVVVSGEPVCALTLSRATGGVEFTAQEAELAADFAAQVGLAVELTQARADRQRVELADERSRIARDLHDHVIQRLFGAGLSLQALAAGHPQAEDAILDLVDVVDGAISEIRMAVFALSDRRRNDAGSTRRRVLDAAQELTAALGATPRISFAGAVDLMVTDGLADDVVAVVRECLANAARHAGARDVSVEIAVDDRDLRVTVVDDGVGIPTMRERHSGTENLAERARRRGGDFTLGPGRDGGTTAVWRAPHGGAAGGSETERRRA